MWRTQRRQRRQWYAPSGRQMSHWSQRTASTSRPEPFSVMRAGRAAPNGMNPGSATCAARHGNWSVWAGEPRPGGGDGLEGALDGAERLRFGAVASGVGALARVREHPPHARSRRREWRPGHARSGGSSAAERFGLRGALEPKRPAPEPEPEPEAAAASDGYISGVVESSDGLEAGVWVIAETEELETKFAKIVVTDDNGRFVLPELPDVAYDVWVRGYGLVDSEKVKLSPSDEEVQLTGVVAPNEIAAAQYYPGNYWYSMIEPPPASEFPGTGPDGNGISPNLKSQAAWLDIMKQGCQLCHQLGNLATREVQHVDEFDSTAAAWDHRVKTGQRGTAMSATMTRFGRERALDMFADWSDRIAAGATPPRPPRPKGKERNLVVTLWDWGNDASFIHDEITTDKRTPTVNAGGPVYGVSAGHGSLTIVDPVANSAVELPIPVRPEDPNSVPSRFPQEQMEPSYYWGDQLLWGRGGPDGQENCLPKQ